MLPVFYSQDMLKYILTAFFIFGLTVSYAQEKVYEQYNISIPAPFVMEIDDTVYASTIIKPNGWSSLDADYTVLRFDLNGNLVDTIQLLQTVNGNPIFHFYSDAHYEPSSGELKLLKVTDLGGGVLSNYYQFHFEVRDKYFNLLSTKTIKSPDSSVASASNIYSSGDTTLITGSTRPIGGFFAYQFVNNVITDSLYINNNIGFDEPPYSIVKLKDKYVIGSINDNPKLLILNQDLTTDTILQRLNSSLPGYLFYKLERTNQNKVIAFGLGGTTYFSVYEIDTNLNIKTLLRVPANALDTNESINSPLEQWIDYRSPDSVFAVLASDTLAIVRLTANDKVVWPMKVFLTDTSGTLHWQRVIYDSTAAYSVQRIIATSDGGALIFSAKYDWSYKTEVHWRLSVIKIQGNGDIISEKEYALPNAPQVLEVYPNPAAAQVHFRLPEQQSAYRYQLLNRAGQVVQRGTLSEGESSLEVDHLPAGHYFLNLTQVTNARQSWSGVFQKVD